MVRFEPTELLESYISLITLNFSEMIHYGIGVEIEKKRQFDTRLGILAVLKLYKNIPLDNEEKELLEEFPLQEDTNVEIERYIQFIVFKIGQRARESVNNLRNTLDRTIFILDRGINRDENVVDYLIKVRDNQWDYIERLDEYNNSFVHAYVFKNKVKLMDLDRRMIEPTINFDSECFIPKEIREKTREI